MIQIDSLCSTPLWDNNLTWYTDNPDFTPCFQNTVLTWIPSGLFFLFIPLDIYHIVKTNNGGKSWNMKNGSKFAVVTLLLLSELITIITMFYNCEEEEELLQADLSEKVSSLVQIITLVAIMMMMLLSNHRGIKSSGNMFLFWFLSTISELIIYRSLIMSLTNQPGNYNIYLLILKNLKLPLKTAMVYLNFLNDGEIDVNAYNSQNKLDFEDKCSYPAKMTFWWILPLIRLGARKKLDVEDVEPLNEYKSAKKLCEKLENKMMTNGKLEFYKGVMKGFGFKYMGICIIFLLQSFLVFGNPLIMILLMEHVSSDQNSWKGIFYAILLLLVNLTKAFINERCIFKMFEYAMLLKGALCAVIYKKSLRLSPKASKNWTSGEIVNLVSVDLQRIQEALQFAFPLVSGIAEVLVSCSFLLSFLGLSSLAGIAVFVILIPGNSLLSNVIHKIQIVLMEEKDRRVKMITEVLNGIKVLKLYAWEQPFEDLIYRLRTKEINTLRKSFIVENIMIISFIISQFLVPFFTFVVYVYGFNKTLTPDIAFVSLSLFNILRLPMGEVPFVIGQLIKCASSFSRISTFLKCEEIDISLKKNEISEEIAISVKDGSFSWEQHGEPNLDGININIKVGSLIAIVGEVGCGKSSFIASIIGETYKKQGSVKINGTLAYVPQQSWIQNNTVKDNILFNSEINQRRYSQIVENCELKQDFRILAAGDYTEIGEKGLNLSGGQKQRISIARAVYSNKDIYLFDDPLSAVDSNVAKKLFDNVIGPKGILRKKTRILVTHGLKCLPECDYIYIMEKGKIVAQGSYEELSINNQKFANLMTQFIDDDNEIHKNVDDEIFGINSTSRSYSTISSEKSNHKSSMRKIEKKMSFDESNIGRLIESEVTEEGSISSKVYLHYFKNVGIICSLAMLVGFTLMMTFDLAANQWLSSWSSDFVYGIAFSNHKVSYRIGIYGLFGLLQAICFGFGLVMFTLGAIRSAKKTHNMMLYSVMRAPMSLFDTTPTGRLLNRFSRDINAIDTTLFMELQKLIYSSLRIIAGIVIICIDMPPFVIISLIMVVTYITAIALSMRSLRQLMRLESIHRSPIYSYVQESNIGAASIRAYNVVDIFTENMYRKIDENQKFYFGYIAINSWMAVFLQILGAFFIFFTALVAVFMKSYIGPASVGLTINYAISVTLTLNLIVRYATIVESNVISVERILEYANLPQEAIRNVEVDKNGRNWPSQGEIQFKSYKTRYRDGLDLVLKGLNYVIRPKEKVGIVGRTGAGKSSLTLALFRIIEAAGGSIVIDGVNIADIGIHDLRSKLSIIPQDSVLFYGSLRMNIDPFNDYKDEEIWSALEHSHLKSFVSDLPSGLQYLISEFGQNLSIGQRQLICLTRALLRRSKILILDEATAAVDITTDNLIQQTIRREFKESTILTIAHRLNTIMDSDKVLVLSDGNILESGSPKELIMNTESVFHDMCKDAGII